MVKGGEKGGKVFVRSRTKVSNIGHFRQDGRKGRKHILSGYIYLHTQGLHHQRKKPFPHEIKVKSWLRQHFF